MKAVGQLTRLNPQAPEKKVNTDNTDDLFNILNASRGTTNASTGNANKKVAS